jgi:hypothetical protein
MKVGPKEEQVARLRLARAERAEAMQRQAAPVARKKKQRTAKKRVR